MVFGWHPVFFFATLYVVALHIRVENNYLLGVADAFVIPNSHVVSSWRQQQQLPGSLKDKAEPDCDVMGCDIEGESPVESAPVRGRKRRSLIRSVKSLMSTLVDEDNVKSKKDGTKNEVYSAAELSERLFDKIDLNKDGLLTRNELSSAGVKMNVINSIDVNRDGEIGKDEFLRAVRMAEEEPQSSSSSAETDALADEIDDTLGELEPLERQELRLGGFEPYILVSVLTAEASFETIKDYSFDWDEVADVTDITELLSQVNWFAVGVEFAGAGSTVFGLYATVIFSLSILYGKTALGLDRDEEYYNFMDKTGLQRFRAFQAFSWGLYLFCVSVFLVVVDKTPGLFRFPLAAASLAFLYFGKAEYDVVMEAAAPMFMPRKSATEKDKDD